MVIFLGIIMLVLITLPLVIQLLQGEAKQSVNRQKATVAFQLAETAVAKGVAALTSNSKNLSDAFAGIPIAGYNDDTEYTDMQGGKYKIKMTPGNSTLSVLIVGKGADTSSREVKVVEAEYSALDPDASAVILNQGYVNNNNQRLPADFFSAHWGSVKSFNNMDYQPNVGYPRLYSAGRIGERDTDPVPPNTNNVDYWAYQTNMGSPPLPDLAYYKVRAQNSIFPNSTAKGEIKASTMGTPARNPANSGYFQSSLNLFQEITFDKLVGLPLGLGNYYEVRNSTSVLYFDSKLADGCSMRFGEVFLDVEAVILPFSGAQIDKSTVTYHVFMATIPASAPAEYQGTKFWGAGTKAQAQSFWINNFVNPYAQPNHCCYGIPNLKIHGYVFMGTSLSRPWFNSNVLGVVQAQTDPNWVFFDSPSVYYDPEVYNKIKWSQAPLYRTSWKETKRSW